MDGEDEKCLKVAVGREMRRGVKTLDWMSLDRMFTVEVVQG